MRARACVYASMSQTNILYTFKSARIFSFNLSFCMRSDLNINSSKFSMCVYTYIYTLIKYFKHGICRKQNMRGFRKNVRYVVKNRAKRDCLQKFNILAAYLGGSVIRIYNRKFNYAHDSCVCVCLRMLLLY